MTQEEKQQAHEILCRRYLGKWSDGSLGMSIALRAIDTRLDDYFKGIVEHPDLHNGYEILGAVKFLRLLRTYEFNERRVQQVIQLREGEWTQDERGRWHHVRGGIKCPGTDTAHVYRWQPFQVFVLASVFGFHTWFNTEVRAIDKPELLMTEREREDGYVEDFRRLCNYFVLYTPRKTDKTGMSAYIQVVFFLMGDYNSEIYCCANAEFQSRILFGRTTFMLNDVDTRQRFDMTSRSIKWKPKFHSVRNAMIMPLTAGGKTKDGPFAELVNWDELGSSPYTNGKSDMMNLVNVMRSSMGPRREGLTFGTTTAGTITSGPFPDEILPGLHNSLMMELKYDTGEEQPTLSGDRQLCLLLEPDDWEKQDEQLLLTSKDIRRKINPMLGVTCQHQFYEDSIADMYNGKMTKAELFSKLFNVYMGMRVTKWLTGDQIRQRQVDRRITDCKYADGWQVFVGMDFGGNDDLFAISYLGVNYRPDQPADQRMFADCEVWIVEKALQDSPNRALYELWVQQGWLKVCPGEVFNPDNAINDLMQKTQQGLNLYMFGYDPAQSILPINTVKAWLQSLGIDANTIKGMVVPVSQSFVTMNGLLQHLEYMLLGMEYNTETGGWSFSNFSPPLFLSNSPLWPWGFGNAKVEISSSELRAIRKTNHHTKIDMIHALLDACYVFDLREGQIQQ
jgi:phage terminase large subunit-like protein